MNKICHMSSAHSRFDTRIFEKECFSLAIAGYEVILIVADGEPDEIKKGISILSVEKHNSKFKRITRTTAAIYKKAVVVNADIYHLHDPELIPVGVKLKKQGKIVIFDSHEYVEKQLLNKPYFHPLIACFISIFYSLYERRAVSKFDLIVTATPFICDKFKKFHNNVIDINNYPIVGELKRDPSIVRTSNYVAYIGVITEIRGIKQIVKALELCKTNVRLKLAGNFFSQSLRNEVIKYEGWKKVEELGHVDRKGVQSILSEVRAGLVTFLPALNHFDSQPNKMFEYMSAGIPVIASNFPLWKTIIEDEKCGICVDPTDPKAIAQAIDWIIEYPEDGSLLGKNGLRSIKKYNWGIEEEKLLKAYKGIGIVP